MNLHEEVQQARQAKELLENAVFKAAIDNIRAGIYEKWRIAPIRDKEGMHELKLMDKVLSEIEGYFKQVIETGKMAEIQLEQEEKLARLKQHGIR
jgi:hypothetical protein